MSVAAPEAPPKAPDLGPQARSIAGLLREYAHKLGVLGKTLLDLKNQLMNSSYVPLDQIAWALDQSEMLQKPIITIVNSAVSCEDSGTFDSFLDDEIRLRRTETELHLHHVIRLAGDIRNLVRKQHAEDKLAQLRVAAGLSGMKGGPLRPN